jgi:hypothetical protein
MQRFASISILFAAVACGSSPHPATAPSNTATTTSTTTTTTTTTTPPADGGGDGGNVCANHPDELGPYVLSADQVSHRVGQGQTALASMPASTKEHPIEVCGVGSENAWLAATTCANGKHAYAGPEDVEASRAGDLGPGGRCGAIIDLYKVACPEKTYEVYMDMYMCGPDESFM